MNKRYHASASQTLAAIQSLYEDKLLSYPRTDCAYITDEEFEYLVANLTKYLGLVSKPVALTNTTPNKRYVNGKKVGKLYLMITKPISKKQPPYRSFTKATRLKQIYKRRKKKRPHQYRLPKGH